VLAGELGLAFAVGLLAMSADATRPAAVARIDLHDGDSRVLRLVRKEAEELVERPTREPVPSVSTSSRYPFADTLEVLKRDAAAGVFGGLDDRLADAVVFVATEPGFLAGQPSEFLLGSLRPFPLEPFSLHVVLAANLLDRLAAMPLGIVAGGRDLGDPKIDTKEIVGLNRIGRFPVELDVQEESALPLHQLGGGGLDSLEHLPLVRAGLGVDTLAGIKQRQANGPVPLTEGEDASIVGDRCRLEFRVCFLGDLESGAHASDRANGQVGGEPERLADFVVAGPLDQDLVGRMLAAGHVGNVVARPSECPSENAPEPDFSGVSFRDGSRSFGAAE